MSPEYNFILFSVISLGGALAEIGVFLALGIFFKKREDSQKFSLLRYGFLFIPPIFATIVLFYLLGIQVVKVFVYSAILGTAIEGIIGFFFSCGCWRKVMGLQTIRYL